MNSKTLALAERYVFVEVSWNWKLNKSESKPEEELQEDSEEAQASYV